MMIKWIRPYLGTGAAKGIKDNGNIYILDVRDILDRKGNSQDVVLQKIKEGIEAIKSGKKVVVTCDHGISRSNAIATGIISLYEGITFIEALKIVYSKTGENEIKIEVIETVRKSIEKTKGKEKSGEKRKIAITGTNGFIGKRFSELFGKRKDFEIFPIRREEIDLIKEKIKLEIFIKENGIDTMIHLANPRNYTNNVSMGETISMLKNILDVCYTNNVYLIYPSSWVVFSGYRGQEIIVDETYNPRPKDTYSYTKFLAEQLIIQYSTYLNLKMCILRICPVYGEGSDKPRFIWNFIEYAMKNKDIGIHKYKNGFPKIELLHVDDLCNALAKITETKPEGILNIGTGKSMYVKDIAKKIIKLLGSKSKIYHIKIDDFTSNIVLDISKAKNLLKWSPKISIEDGLKRLIKKIE